MSEKSDPAFRVIIQFVAAAEGTPAHYRVIAYRDKIALGPAKFYSAEELSQKLKKAGLPPGQEPELPAQELRETKVVYAEEVALSSRQLQLLGLNEH